MSAAPALPPMEFLVAWVLSEREQHRGVATPLDEAQRGLLQPYFHRSTLDGVRVRYVENLENPSFASDLRRMAIPLPIDFEAIAGLTLVDTIVVVPSRLDPSRSTIGVIFQECVHVCQYAALGVQRFIEEYLRSWETSGRAHENVSLERFAESMRLRFEAGHPVFSVEDALAEVVRKPLDTI